MHKSLTTLVAFGLGACTTAALSSSAATSPANTSSVSTGFVRNAAELEHRTAPNGTAKITRLAQGNEAFVGLLEMNADGAVPQHRDTTEEYIYVLEGGGTITIDGVSSELRTGSIVYMPANAEVSYTNGPQSLRALQIFAGPEPAAKYDAWQPTPPA